MEFFHTLAICLLLLSIGNCQNNKSQELNFRIQPLSAVTFQIDYVRIIKQYGLIPCSLTIYGSTNANFLSLQEQKYIVYNKTCAQMFSSKKSKHHIKYIEVWNFELKAANIVILFTQPNSTVSSKLLNQSLTHFSTLAKNDNIQAVLMFKDNIYDYILPFNLITEKTEKIIVQENCGHDNLQATTYENQPYLETYWNEHKKDQLILQWLPYFSNCQSQTSGRLFLNELINPKPRINLQENNQIICKNGYSYISGEILECEPKVISTQCLLEQLYVKNTDKQPWWHNTANVPYYFFKSYVTHNQFINFIKSDTILQETSEEYYNYVVPLKYEANFNDRSEIPNYFQMKFKVSGIENEKNRKYEFVSAQLKAMYRANLQDERVSTGAVAGTIYLTITVEYLSEWNNFQEMLCNSGVYIVMYCLIAAAVIVSVRYCLGKKQIKLNFMKNVKLIIFPALKGFFMAFFSAMSFVTILFELCALTSYEAISVTFNGDELGDLHIYYAGRVGLTLFFTGYFLLNTGINQSFKVLTPDETKIILEDDAMQKQRALTVSSLQQEPNEEEKQAFIIKNMNSHRKYLILYLFSFSFFLLYMYYNCARRSFAQSTLILLVLYPIVQKLLISLYRHYIIKELLYLYAVLISHQAFYDLLLLKDVVLYQLIVLYICKSVAQNVIGFGLEMLAEHLVLQADLYMKHCDESNLIGTLYRFLSLFKKEISDVIRESKYEKSLFYATLLSLRVTASLIRPFLILLIIISIKYNQLCEDLHIPFEKLLKKSIILFCFIPLEIGIMLIHIKVLDSHYGLFVTKCLQFNKFKFNRRRVKWINDSFTQNKCVQYFYREFEKFCFSSQMYLLVFLLVFSMFTIMIGMKIILEASYIAYADPALLIIFCTIWVSGYFLSILLSFITIKLKFYDRKEQIKMRAKLENIEKILRKSDYSEYLQVQAVKNYFLFHCKEWIISNLTAIFNKEDFQENNYELLSKYKHYKSLLKKRQIEERKKREQENEERKQVKNLLKIEKDRKIVIKLPKESFDELAKPIVLEWLYIAKQFTYLKGLVNDLKEKKKKETCEFCSMNIELEVIEKNEFAEIVNQYRLMNVGRILETNHFIEFYKYKQEYITVCIECKDRKIYLQKKHLQVAGIPYRLLQKWLIISRSRLLHRQQTKSVEEKAADEKRSFHNTLRETVHFHVTKQFKQ